MFVCVSVVGRVLLNVRIGTLEQQVSPKIQEFIAAIARMFLTGHQLMAFARVHQLLRTRTWRDHVQAWDTIYALSKDTLGCTQTYSDNFTQASQSREGGSFYSV